MVEPAFKATVGTYRYGDGASTEFVGLQGSFNGKNGSVGMGLSVATDNL